PCSEIAKPDCLRLGQGHRSTALGSGSKRTSDDVAVCVQHDRTATYRSCDVNVDRDASNIILVSLHHPDLRCCSLLPAFRQPTCSEKPDIEIVTRRGQCQVNSCPSLESEARRKASTDICYHIYHS